MKKKKLFCMLLSIVMAVTTINLPAAASEIPIESADLIEKTSIEKENAVTRQETTKEHDQGITAKTEEQSEMQNEESTESKAQQSSAIETETEDLTQSQTEESSVTETETEDLTQNQESSVIETETEDLTQNQESSVTETETLTETLTEETTTVETEPPEGTTALETEESTEITTEESTDSKRQDTKLQVSYRTTDEILTFLEQENAAKTDKITYKEQPVLTAPYKSGALSDDTLDSAMAMVRQIRFIAGLPYDISINQDYNKFSQSAALVNYINNELSSEPSQPDDMPEELFEQGYEGASHSNIAYASQQTQTLNETLLDTWMAAKDQDAISQLESRRTVLNPSMEQIGFGAVKGSNGIYSAMYTANHSGDTENIFGIAWPAQNMPIEYFGSDYPWSVSTNETLKASEIQVTLTRESDGKKWSFAKDSADGDFYVDNDSTNQKSCIIFRPKTSDITAYEDEDLFQIEITKNKKPYICYTVQFFSIAEEEEILTAPKASISSGEVVAKESKLVLASVEDAEIYYTLDGTTPSIESTLYTEPISIEADMTVKAIAVKEGFADSDIAEFVYTVAEDEPLRYTITFESNGGTIVPAQSILENEKIELPETPVKEGFLLEGWFKEAECETIWNFEKDIVTADTTLYAKWTEDPSATIYTVTFELQEHGTPIESLTIKNGELLTAPEPPTAEGYQFEGWFKEIECETIWDFEKDIVTADTTLYAKWTVGEIETETETQTTDMADTCLVTFDLQGIGTQIEPITVTNGETFAAPKAPTAEGYTFAEWYREAGCVNAWDFEANIVTEDIVLYAKWVPADNADISMSASQEPKAEDTRIDLGAKSTETKVSDIKPRRYNGKPYEPSVTVSISNGKKRITLKKDRDYTLKYQNNINAGVDTASVTISGIGEYKGDIKRTFTIDPPIDLTADSTQTIVKSIKSRVYNGKPYEPNVTVSILDGKKRVTLKKDKDYTLTYKNNTNANTDKTQPSVTITGIGEYKGSKTETFTITRKSIKKLKVITGSILNGGTPSIVIYDDSVKLNNNLFLASYDREDPRKVKLTLEAKPNTNYEGTVTVNLTVYEVEKEYYINNAKVEITGDTTYTGKSISRNVEIKMGDTYLQNNKDYKVQYQNNTNAGTAVMIITGKGQYKGKFVGTFTINKVDVNKRIATDSTPKYVDITNISPKTYNGKEQKPAVTIKTIRNKKLALNKDYTVSYSNNLHSGTAQIMIKGIGNNCSGSTNITFEIEPQDIKKASVSVTKATDKVPSKVVLKYNKKELQEYADYHIESYEEDGKKVKVTITGRADFKGKVTKNLKTEIPAEEPNNTPAISSNINRHNYSDFKEKGLEVNSTLLQNDDGTLTRVEFVSGKGVYIESYLADYQFDHQEKFIKPELPIYGGFYESKDNYFLVFGQQNMDEDNNKEVLRFVKYSKTWERLGDARLYGINTTTPFEFGTVCMEDHEGVLYVRTCHEMYRDGGGNIHEANMSFSINIESMKVLSAFYTIGGPAYVSHSLNQYITMDDSYLITADHGDAYPRCMLLTKHAKGTNNTFFESSKNTQSVTALKLEGATGGNNPWTGASLGGLEATETHYLVAGNSIDQNVKPWNRNGIKNIFLSSTPKDNFTNAAVKLHWITNYTAADKTSVSTPHLVKVNSNETVLIWMESKKITGENGKEQTVSGLKSVLLNAVGEPISGIYTFEGALSDCKPIVDNGKILWYYTNNSQPVFCTLNVDDVRKQPR